MKALDGREICGQRVRVEMRKKERRNGGDDRDRRYFYLSKNFALSPKKFVVFLTRLFDFKILALVLLALRWTLITSSWPCEKTWKKFDFLPSFRHFFRGGGRYRSRSRDRRRRYSRSRSRSRDRRRTPRYLTLKFDRLKSLADKLDFKLFSYSPRRGRSRSRSDSRDRRRDSRSRSRSR